MSERPYGPNDLGSRLGMHRGQKGRRIQKNRQGENAFPKRASLKRFCGAPWPGFGLRSRGKPNIDQLFGKGKRSAFLTEIVEREVRRQKQPARARCRSRLLENRRSSRTEKRLRRTGEPVAHIRHVAVLCAGVPPLSPDAPGSDGVLERVPDDLGDSA